MTPAPSGIQVFETELFVPEYRPMQHGDWTLAVRRPMVTQGYWGPAALSPAVPVLHRDGDVWMSLMPLEFESQSIGILLARGHVLIHGMGLGWAAAATAMREEVSAVTVVEQDPDVLALHADLGLFAQLPDAARQKLRIVQGDACRYVPDAPVDLLMPDIWLPLVSDGRVEEVRAMQVNADANGIYFWGQELEIARHARAAGHALDADGIAATIAGWNLPIVGTEWPDYPALIAIASERWMRGRWFSAA